MNRDRRPTRWRRWRGRIVHEIRNSIYRPVSCRLSVDRCRRLHALRRRLIPRRYTDADPFALVEIDPHRIERSLLETAPKRPQWGRVVDGEWDQQSEPFDERAVPRGLRERFVDGLPWRETSVYDAFCDQLARFGNAWGYHSISQFDRRCTEIAALYDSLRHDGYRRQDALADTASPRLAHRADEINVDIGRDGELYWRAYGQHRLALAKLLDIEAVPVLIHRRHRRWQRRRDRLCRSRQARTRTAAIPADHPDLRPPVGREGSG